MNQPRSLREFVRQIYRTYVTERPTHFAASLAYYSLFSLVPVIYISLLVAGMFVDDELARERLREDIQTVMGSDVTELLVRAFADVNQDSSSGSIWHRIIALAALLFAASLVFFQLQYALTSIWNVPPPDKGSAKQFLINRLLAFLMVLFVGLLVVLATFANIVLTFLDSHFDLELLTRLGGFAATLVIGTLSLALMFKILPNAIVSWKDAAVGACVTALLLIIGGHLVGLYISRGGIQSAMEAAGAVAVLLISVYFLAQFLVFGTVFTRVYANMYGDGIRLPPGRE